MTPLHVLCVEGDPGDFDRVQRHLEGCGLGAECRQVASLAELEAAIAGGGWDVVLSNDALPDVGFEEVLCRLRPLSDAVPLILVSRRVGEERVAEAFKQGAWDYVAKDNLGRLVPAIERSVEIAKERRARWEEAAALRESEGRLAAVFDSVTTHIAVLDGRGVILAVNESWKRFAAENPMADGTPARRCGVGTSYLAVCRERQGPSMEGAMAAHDGILAVLEGRLSGFVLEYPCHSPAEQRWFLMAATPLNHGRRGAVVAHLNISQRKAMEYQVLESEARFRALFDHCPDGVIMLRAEERRIVAANEAICRMLGYSLEELLRLGVADLHPAETMGRMTDDLACLDHGRAHFASSLPVLRKDRSVFLADISAKHYEVGGQGFVVGLFRDTSERDLAERRTQDSRNFLNSVLEQSPLPTWISDDKGTLLRLNKACCDILRITPEEVVGRYNVLRDNIVVEQGAMPLVRSVFEEGKNVSFDLRYETAQLTTVVLARTVAMDLHVTIFPILDKAGRITHAVIQHLDVTERKRAGEALERSERLLRLALEVGQIGVFEVEIATGKSTWSRVVEGIWGLPAGFREDFQQYCWEHVHPEDRVRVADDYSRLLREGTEREMEFRVERGEGDVRWLRWRGRVIRDGAGVARRIVGVNLDVTDREQTEAALQQGLLFRREAERIARIGAWKVNPESDYLYWTEGVYEILGIAPDSKPGLREGLKFYDAESIPILLDALRAAFRDGTPFAIETGVRTATGRRLRAEVRGLGRVEEGGQAYVMGTFQDITERKCLEEQFRQAQKLEAVGQLAGGVAHDFNNILAAMIMRLGLLEISAQGDKETGQAVKELINEVQRAAGLIRQLLMFSRRSVMEIKPLDLNEVVKELLRMLGRLIGENIKLLFDGYTGDLPAVEGDAGMLQQVIMNLVVNARDALPHGGRITIGTSIEAFDDGTVSLNRSRQTGCFVCLSVSDTGMGMSRETLGRIFEPFFTTKEAGKGTGLGLATVHGIVAQHKGWVEVESGLGEGTRFRVFLPIVAGTAVEAAVDETPEPPARGCGTILLVEDEAQVRQLVARTLRALGYGVHEAENGQQAMQEWQRHGADVDLLLTDMVMPEGVTGLELAERLMAMKPSLRVIVSSGYSAEIVKAGSSDRAGIHYLPKPYPLRVLAETVRACLDRRS